MLGLRIIPMTCSWRIAQKEDKMCVNMRTSCHSCLYRYKCLFSRATTARAKKGCLLFITSFCTCSSLKFTPITQVVLHALEVRVQTPVTPQQQLSKLFSFPIHFVFRWWKFPADKDQVQGCAARADSGKQHQEETFPSTLTVQGRFWTLQLMLSLPSLILMSE